MRHVSAEAMHLLQGSEIYVALRNPLWLKTKPAASPTITQVYQDGPSQVGLGVWHLDMHSAISRRPHTMGQSSQSLAVKSGNRRNNLRGRKFQQSWNLSLHTALSRHTQFQLLIEHNLMGVFDSCAWRTTEKPYTLKVAIINSDTMTPEFLPPIPTSPQPVLSLHLDISQTSQLQHVQSRALCFSP